MRGARAVLRGARSGASTAAQPGLPAGLAPPRRRPRRRPRPRPRRTSRPSCSPTRPTRRCGWGGWGAARGVVQEAWQTGAARGAPRLPPAWRAHQPPMRLGSPGLELLLLPLPLPSCGRSRRRRQRRSGARTWSTWRRARRNWTGRSGSGSACWRRSRRCRCGREGWEVGGWVGRCVQVDGRGQGQSYRLPLRTNTCPALPRERPAAAEPAGGGRGAAPARQALGGRGDHRAPVPVRWVAGRGGRWRGSGTEAGSAEQAAAALQLIASRPAPSPRLPAGRSRRR